MARSSDSSPPTTFSDAAFVTANRLDGLRLFFALLVVDMHSYEVFTTGKHVDPLTYLTRGQLGDGTFAVHGFFVISGFLIAASWQRSASVGDFFRRRALRIYPGFLVCCVFCAFVLAPCLTPDPARYFRELDLVRFVKNALLLNRIELPPFGPDNPGQINGSLWTIKIEFECYILMAVLGLTGMLRRTWFCVGLMCSCWALSALVIVMSEATKSLPFGGILYHALFHLLFCAYFMLGALIYIHRERVPYSRRWFLTACLLFAVACVTRTGAYLFPPVIAYGVLYVGLSRRPASTTRLKADLSYGAYLYGWPLQWWITTLIGRDIAPALFTLLSIPVTLAAAYVSWHYVEAPALKRIRRERATGSVPALQLGR